MPIKDALKKIFWNYILLFIAFVPCYWCNCCSKTTGGSCQEVCEQIMSLPVKNASEQFIGKVEELNRVCSPRMVSFWRCINETLDHASEYENRWPGKKCCDLTRSDQCSEACETITSMQNIQNYCNYKTESNFYECFYHGQMEENCCKGATSLGCYSSCARYFQDYTNTELTDSVSYMCEESSPTVVHCVNNFTRITSVASYNPFKYLHCCEFVSTSECKNFCQNAVHTKVMKQNILTDLQNEDCTSVINDDELWRCFQAEDNIPSVVDEETTSVAEVTIVEGAKLHCCLKAVSSECQKLCFKIFSNKWIEASTNFDPKCLSYTLEEALNHCLDEVEEPCELGCQGLSYCDNFNGRSTQLFRSCSAASDKAAHNDVLTWQSQGYFIMFGYQLPLKNITSCSPLMWKSMACILRIKPCHQRTHTTSLCSEDCYKLLSHCLDWGRITDGINISMLCKRFSNGKSSSSCVPIQNFLEHEDTSLVPSSQYPVSSPCRNNPCSATNHQVCLINRNCQSTKGHNCYPYTCTSGCRLGVASKYSVPEHTFVHLPVALKDKKCYKVCQCTGRHRLEKCQQLPCLSFESCWILGRKIEHGSQFHMDCSVCSCFAGEIICIRQPCESSKLATYLYDCVPNHIPVCGKNGKTYANSCIAKRAGLSDSHFTYGECIQKDVCDESICGENEICVPDRKVCLSSSHEFCTQYRCVNVRRSCKKVAHEMVCDTDGREHVNVCYMYKYQKTLAYRGPCQRNCDRSGPVCGIDGNTYASECHAHANMVNTDYEGRCVAVGLSSEHQSSEQSCSPELVKCPPLAVPNCRSITPPGACCPVCAGGLKILYSKKQVDHLLSSLRIDVINSLSVTAVLRALERHVQTAECAVRGFLTHESYLFVLLVPTTPVPSPIQLDACSYEAEKLAVAIRKSSPRMSSELSLSILINAIEAHNSHSVITLSYSDSSLAVSHQCPRTTCKLLIFITVIFILVVKL